MTRSTTRGLNTLVRETESLYNELVYRDSVSIARPMIQVLNIPLVGQPHQDVRTAAQLRAGESGRILAIDTARPSAKRLADMGFIQGASVVMIRPGKPCIIRIGERYVGLGLSLQACIHLALSVPERCTIASEATLDSPRDFERLR